MKVAGALALVVGFAVLAAVCAVLVSNELPERHSARGVMVASPKQPPAGTASPELVRTYAELLKSDPAVIRRVAEATDQSRSAAEDALRVRPDENSLLVRISVDASSREESLAGLDAVTEGFSTGKAAAVLDPENLQLLDRSSEEITLPEPGYRASRSVLITTPPASTGDPQGPTRLAADFAGVIPQDDELLRAAGKPVGLDAKDIRRDLTVRAASNTSVMNFTLRGSDYEETRTALVALMRRLRDDGGGAGRINAGDLRVAHFPDTDAPAARSSVPTAIIGGVVGASIGAMVALGLARRRRIRHAQPA